MLYPVYVTVPRNTPPDDPHVESVEVEGNVITEIDILIPYGHMALTGISFWYGDDQIHPTPKGSWIKGNEIWITHKTRILLPERYNVITVKAFNLDEVYDHTFYVYIHTKYIVEVAELYDLLKELKALRDELRKMTQWYE
jgi:hypothetical protein